MSSNTDTVSAHRQSSDDSSNKIAIVGMGALFPQARDLSQYWANIKRGIDTLSDIPQSHWRPADHYSNDPKATDRTYARRGGFLAPVAFEPLRYGILPKALEATDTTQLLGLMVAEAALRDAGLERGDKRLREDRVSVVLGVTSALELLIPLSARLGEPQWRDALSEVGIDPVQADDVVERISNSYVGWQEASFPGLLGNVAAGRIANRFDLSGSNCVVDAACASSLAAVHLGMLELLAGRTDWVVAGGLDTFNHIFMYMCFSKTPALSPSGDARPYSNQSDGTMLGEGLGLTVLKRLEDAEADGDRIYAVICGMGTSSDGSGMAIYEPSAQGQAKALQQAYDQAGFSPSTIGLVEGHGTGTRKGDAVEIQALRKVYETQTSHMQTEPWCALGSVKSQIGHTKAAAGAAGLIKAAHALYAGVLPPTLKADIPHPAIDEGDSANTAFYINRKRRPWLTEQGVPRRAAVSAFGFGGSNYHCVLESYDAAKHAAQESQPHFDGDVQIVAFSDTNQASVLQTAIDWIAQAQSIPLESERWPFIRSSARALRAQFTQNVQTGAQSRIVCVLDRSRCTESLAQWDTWAKHNQSQQTLVGLPAARIFTGQGAPQGKVAWLYPGQGSQRVQMLADVACTFEQMHAALGQACAQAPHLDLGDKIFPPVPAQNDTQSKQAQAQALTQTQVAQPALAAVEVGLSQILRSFGLQPDGVAGHSFGELPALWAAGCLPTQALHQLAQVRGARMAEASEHSPGGMIAIQAGSHTVAALLQRLHNEGRIALHEATLANANAPLQSVVAGTLKGLWVLEEALQHQKTSYKRLQVGAPFHSPAVAKAAEPLAAALQDVAWQTAHCPIYGNTEAVPYPADKARSKDLLAQQLARPVQFEAMVQAMLADGFDTFVEVGPGAALTGLVKACAAQTHPKATAMACDVHNQDGDGAGIAFVLAELAAQGRKVSLEAWDGVRHGHETTEFNTQKNSFWYPISGANHRDPQKAIASSTKRQQQDKNTQNALLHSKELLQKLPQKEPSTLPGAALAQTSPESDIEAPMTHTQEQSLLLEALRATQKSLETLKQQHEETARLHSQFLTQQAASQNALHALMQNQQALQNQWATGSQASTEFTPAPMPEATAALPELKAPAPMPSNALAAPEAEPHSTAEAWPVPVDAEEDVQEAEVPPPAPHTAYPEALKSVVEVISKSTGFPAEMLAADQRLDTDLGVDSIKRVEIFSALTEHHPSMASLDSHTGQEIQTLGQLANLLATSLQTSSAPPEAPLQHDAVVVPFTPLQAQETHPNQTQPQTHHSRHGNAAPATRLSPVAQPQIQSQPEARSQQDAQQYVAQLLQVVAEATGYPQEMLQLPMQLDTDLGIDSIKRVEIFSNLAQHVPELGHLDNDAMAKIQSLQDVVDWMVASAAHSSAAKTPSPTTSSEPQSASDAIPSNKLAEVLLDVVATATGYPSEMLELSMRLDTDLGIDSIKRVEILSAFHEAFPELPEPEPNAAQTAQTLQEVVALWSHAAPTAALADVADATDTTAPSIQTHEALNGSALGASSDSNAMPAIDPAFEAEIIALDTLRPAAVVPASAAMPKPDVSEADVSKPQGEENEIYRQIPYLAPLTPRGTASQWLDDVQGRTAWITGDDAGIAEAVAHKLSQKGWQASVVWPGQNTSWPTLPEHLDLLLLLGSTGQPPEKLLKSLFAGTQHCAPTLRQTASARGAMLMTATRLDGAFGLEGPLAKTRPELGALAGLAKTAAYEWPEVYCRALDLDPKIAAQQAATHLVSEIEHCGPLEAGIHERGEVRQVALMEASLGDEDDSLALPGKFSAGDVVVITGGARGVTAEIAAALAERVQPRLVLLGRSAKPSPEPSWLLEAHTEAEIKRAIVASLADAPSPRFLESRYRAIQSNRDALRNLARFEQLGAQVEYHSVDVRQAGDIAQVLEDVRSRLGSIAAVIHGAGVLADKRIEDKTTEEFDAVYDTKVLGLQHLLAAIENDPIHTLVVFSSSTARFGRTGQSDYAMANEALNKMAQKEARRREGCRVVAACWGPWAGGMVTTGLAKIFAQEGIGLIPLRAGAQALLRELAEPAEDGDTVEVVLLASSGTQPMLPPKPQKKGSSDAGIDGANADTDGAHKVVAIANAATPKASQQAPSKAQAQAQASTAEEAQPEKPRKPFERVYDLHLDLENHPYLAAHVLDGRPVMPMAMVVEFLGHGALTAHPDMRFVGVDDLRIFKGIVLGDRPQTLQVRIGASNPSSELLTNQAAHEPRGIEIPVEIMSVDAHGTGIPHARGLVQLRTSSSQDDLAHLPLDPIDDGTPWSEPKDLQPYPENIEEIYNQLLFHGPGFQCLKRIEGHSSHGLVVSVETASAPAQWFPKPLRTRWLADPWVLDGTLQAALLWGFSQQRSASLPAFIKRYRQWGPTFGRGEVRVVLNITGARNRRFFSDVRIYHPDGSLIAEMGGLECVTGTRLREAFRRKRLQN